jgi:hypothetical protein
MTFGFGLAGFGLTIEATNALSSLAVPASMTILSPRWKPVRSPTRIPPAPTAEATLSVPSTKRSTPTSKS